VGIDKCDKGRKDIWSTAAYATLWGWPTVDDTADQITICEGEIDAMSLDDMGADMPALSIPSGCSNLGWIENDYEALERFETIYLCFDNDEAGEKAANEVAKRLGITRCKRLRVPAPHNDLNDLLIAGGGLGPLYENAESYDPKTLKPVDGMAAELAEEIGRYQQENEHNPFLFPELKYRFRKGELTIVGGYPGHGKSQWLYQSCMHEMINNDRRACIASFEIPSKSMLFNMLWMHNGHMPKEDSIQSDLTQFQDRLWFIEGVEGGTNSWESLHQDFLYAHRRYGVDLFVIDALMHIAAKDDWSGQERIAKEAAKFAIDNDVTVLLVCHADAKKSGSEQVPEVEYLLGGQGMGAAAHCIVMIWRNKAKEKAVEAGEDVTDEMPDGRMYVPKQRANGVTIYRDLWFDTTRRTFSLEPKPQPGVDLPF